MRGRTLPDSMAVASLWRYPVKTMQGEELGSATVREDGIVGDRGWALRDETRRSITGGRRFGSLMAASARYRVEPEAGAAPGHVDITMPDGAVVGSDDDGVDGALSDLVGSPVSLWPRLPASEKAHYRRRLQTPWAAVADVAALMGIERGDGIPHVHRFPPALIRNETLPGTYFDAAPLLIMTSSTLDAIQQRTPGSQVDVRRFRPNIVLDVDDEASEWPEQAWIGRRLRIGGCVVKVTSTCPRCVMTTRAFADLPEDRAILRTLATEMHRNAGVYAKVVEGGTVDRGDTASPA
ncbi:MAG: MOSC domain-containing protein [Acidimicrobiia bacterium]|nr:MOSC domain-containing protein [Acidimicrobiia bacterium]